ncbi:hypothetical protein [Herbihabitans rhizosphaerae]|uniref:hypothetical protein n=1 Tax=Herbihabitans rhizosphaerae TaxID=1872711 RepID=UPI00102C3FFA|nr:hypothetical protein [Herbihabitans rhizosphaerae]
MALAVGDDGTGARGTVSVVVTRPGTALGAPPWEGALSPGSTTAQARTHSGGNVFIASEPMKGTNRAPFAGQVTAVAQRLGAKL